MRRSPGYLARAIERELAVAGRTAATEVALRRAARSGRRVLVGPFLGEVGYELLYWVPFARKTLARYGIPPEQVVTLTRGGAGCWYRDFAAGELELFDLVEPAAFVERVEARRRRAGDAKQLRGDILDDELVGLARARVGDAAVLHPSFMFARLRGLWFRDEPLDEALSQLAFRPVSRAAPPAGLPADYVAVKLYFSDCLPDDRLVRERVRRLVDGLSRQQDVVLLSTGLVLDEHREWDLDDASVHRIDGLLRPQTNLAVQTAVVAGARALVSTYGGFSYLGPLAGVPTLALYAHENYHPAHAAVADAAFAGVRYDIAGIEDDAAIRAFVNAEAGDAVEVEQ